MESRVLDVSYYSGIRTFLLGALTVVPLVLLGQALAHGTSGYQKEGSDDGRGAVEVPGGTGAARPWATQ